MRGRRCHRVVHPHQTSAQVFAVWRREGDLGQCVRYLVLGSHDGLFKLVVGVDSFKEPVRDDALCVTWRKFALHPLTLMPVKSTLSSMRCNLGGKNVR